MKQPACNQIGIALDRRSLRLFPASGRSRAPSRWIVHSNLPDDDGCPRESPNREAGDRSFQPTTESPIAASPTLPVGDSGADRFRRISKESGALANMNANISQ